MRSIRLTALLALGAAALVAPAAASAAAPIKVSEKPAQRRTQARQVVLDDAPEAVDET